MHGNNSPKWSNYTRVSWICTKLLSFLFRWLWRNAEEANRKSKAPQQISHRRFRVHALTSVSILRSEVARICELFTTNHEVNQIMVVNYTTALKRLPIVIIFIED